MRSKILGACFALLSTAAGAQQFGLDKSVSFTPTVQNAAYASGNAMGGLQTIAFFSITGTGIFDQFLITSKGGSTIAMTLYIFDTNPTGSTCTDKSAFSLATADVSKLAMAPFVLTPAVVGVGVTTTLAQLSQIGSIGNHDSPQAPNLYICIVAGGTVTPASTSDLSAKISGVVD